MSHQQETAAALTLTPGTNNPATFKVTSILFPPLSDAQFELQRVDVCMLTCVKLGPMSLFVLTHS